MSLIEAKQKLGLALTEAQQVQSKVDELKEQAWNRMLLKVVVSNH